MLPKWEQERARTATLRWTPHGPLEVNGVKTQAFEVSAVLCFSVRAKNLEAAERKAEVMKGKLNNAIAEAIYHAARKSPRGLLSSSDATIVLGDNLPECVDGEEE